MSVAQPFTHSSLSTLIAECTKHIAIRHHAAVFFGLFFGVCDYIFTQFQADPFANTGPYAMSKGSALISMLWCAIIVYTTDRRWIRAGIFCLIAATFAGLGIIHQDAAVSNFREGTLCDADGNCNKSTSAFEFMIGYLSMAGLCLLYWVLQTFMGKKTEPGDEGYDDDHGYLPEVSEPGVDDMFETWWEPAEKALELQLEKDASNNTKAVDVEASETNFMNHDESDEKGSSEGSS